MCNLKRFSKKNGTSLESRRSTANEYISKGSSKKKILNFVGLSRSTFYYKHSNNNLKLKPGRPIPGFSKNKNGTLTPDKWIVEKLKAYPFILQKRLDVPKHRRKGTYRKKTIDVFDYGEYLQRNKIETLMSMFKKRFGSSIKSRHHKTQKVEFLTRVIAFNIDRLIRLNKKVILIIIRITRVSY